MNRPDSHRHHESPVNPNDLLDEFDAAWASKIEPVIEDFLLRVPETSRPKLLEDLLAVEWEYRLKLGHRFDSNEYRQRFPVARGAIEKLWNELADQNAENAKSTNLRFQIHRVLARGGIAEILEAWDRTLNRDVAIKILQAQYVDNPDLRRRFRREAEIIAKLEHPGIIPIHDYGHFRNGEPYYAMRLVKDGQTLEDRFLTSQRRPPPEVAPPVPAAATDDTTHAETKRRHDRAKTEIVDAPFTVPADPTSSATTDPGHETFQPPPALSPIETRLRLERFLTLTDTVKFAHSQGVLHRDIKPGNVLLGPYGETILIDWGFALDINAKAEPGEELSEYEKSFASSSVENPGQAPKPFKGTPVYCSPEQAKGKPSTESCDIYSLGATLYHMVTGMPPRQGPVEAVLQDARENRFVPPSAANPGIDQAMEAIIQKAMKTRPQDRYVSAKDLGDDVRRWLLDETPKAWKKPESQAFRIDRIVRKHPKAAVSMATLAVASILAAMSFPAPFDPPNTDPNAPSAVSRTRYDEIQAGQERFASIAQMASELIQSRQAGWTKKVDALLGDLEDIRNDHPEARFPGIERTRIACGAFSDLIETPAAAVSKFHVPVSDMAFRPGTNQIVVVEYDPRRPSSTGRLHLIESVSGNVIWKGIAPLQHHADKPDGISTFAFSHDGAWLVAASRAGQGFLWKLPDIAQAANFAKTAKAAEDARPQLTWTIHDTGTVKRLRWANSTIEGLRLLTLCDDDTVSVWFWGSLENAADGGGVPKDIKPDASRKFDAEVSDLLARSNGANDDRTIFAAIDGRLRKFAQDDPKKTLREIDDAANSPDLGEPFLMAWHPSGSIVTAGRNAICIVEARSSKVLREIRDPLFDRVHHGVIDALKVTSDGQYALTVSGDELDRQLKLWNLDDTRDLIRTFLPGEPGRPCGIVVQETTSPSKRKRIWVWGASVPTPFDLIMPSLYERFPTDVGKIHSMDVTGDSEPRLALLLPSKEKDRIKLEMFDAASRKHRTSFHLEVPEATGSAEIAIAPNGADFAVASSGSFVKIVRSINGDPKRLDLVRLTGSSSNRIGWDMKNQVFGLFASETEIRLLPPDAMNHTGPNVTVFSHHPAKLAAPGTRDALIYANGILFSGGQDGFVRAWNTENPPPKGTVSRIWKTGATPVFSLAVFDDGNWIVCGNQRGELHLIDTGSKVDVPVTTIEKAHPDLISSIAIAKSTRPDDSDRILASGSRDGSLKLWILRNDSEGAKIVPRLELPPMTGSIRKLEFIRGSKLELAVHTEGLFALRIWSIDEILATHQAISAVAEMQ